MSDAANDTATLEWARVEQASARHQTDLGYRQPPAGHGLGGQLHRHPTMHRWGPSGFELWKFLDQTLSAFLHQCYGFNEC